MSLLPHIPEKDILKFAPHNKTTKYLCLLCRGTKQLCGAKRCPILAKYYAYLKIERSVLKKEIYGSSPPGIFIGRTGYPNILIGALVPPIVGDTSLLDFPEKWFGKDLPELVSMRALLLRSTYRVNVRDFSSRVASIVQELSIGRSPTDVEVLLEKKPTIRIDLTDSLPPYGPLAPIKKIRIGTVKTDFRLEKAFYDWDLKAVNAVINLYKNGVPVSKIQKAFSAGILGERTERRFVPTRWSITAVDDIISKYFREAIKYYDTIDKFRIYELDYIDNRWIILMIPHSWMYELIEAWFPKTTWNPYGREVHIFSSHESFRGRSTYAEIGGCYYAARLAVTEKLHYEKKQAAVVVMREAYPGYVLPIGVWNVRESVRHALRKKPKEFETLKDALHYAFSQLRIPEKKWIKTSYVLKVMLFQRKLDLY